MKYIAKIGNTLPHYEHGVISIDKLFPIHWSTGANPDIVNSIKEKGLKFPLLVFQVPSVIGKNDVKGNVILSAVYHIRKQYDLHGSREFPHGDPHTRNYWVKCGCQRLAALKELGCTEVSVIYGYTPNAKKTREIMELEELSTKEISNGL